jgi:DNA modification methylase
LSARPLFVWGTEKYLWEYKEWFQYSLPDPQPRLRVYAGAKNANTKRVGPIPYAWDPGLFYYKPGAEPLRPETYHDSRNWFQSKEWADPDIMHPTPKGVDQMERIIRDYVIEFGLVLSLFSGSGTNEIACKRWGRRYLGIEQSQKYCDEIQVRLAKEKCQDGKDLPS